MNLLVITTTHLFPSDPRPQAGVFFANLLLRLKQHMDHVSVVTPRAYIPGPLLRLPAFAAFRGFQKHQWWNGIEVFRPAYLSLRSVRQEWLMSRTFAASALGLCRRLHDEYRFNLVLGNGFGQPAHAAARIARAIGLRSVAWAIGSDVHTLPHRSAQNLRLARGNLRENDLVLTTSDDLRRALLGIDPDVRNVHVLYRGIDLKEVPADDKAAVRARLGLEAGGVYVLTAGDIETYKGSAEFYECFRQLARARPSLGAIWVGDGSQAAALRRRAQEDGLAGRLLITGSAPRPRLLEYMRAADCMAFPSHAEGVPNVVVEAMAAGLPVVATRVGGIPEIIADGATGLLVPARDATALAAAVERLLAAPDEARRMAGLAGAFVRRHFDVDRNVAVILSVLEHIAQGGSAEDPFPPCADAEPGQLPIAAAARGSASGT